MLFCLIFSSVLLLNSWRNNQKAFDSIMCTSLLSTFVLSFFLNFIEVESPVLFGMCCAKQILVLVSSNYYLIALNYVIKLWLHTIQNFEIDIPKPLMNELFAL